MAEIRKAKSLAVSEVFQLYFNLSASSGFQTDDPDFCICGTPFQGENKKKHNMTVPGSCLKAGSCTELRRRAKFTAKGKSSVTQLTTETYTQTVTHTHTRAHAHTHTHTNPNHAHVYEHLSTNVPMFTCMLQRYTASMVFTLNHYATFTKGADSVRLLEMTSVNRYTAISAPSVA